MATTDDDVIRVGELEIRPSACIAVAGGHTLVLSVRELGLLEALGRRSGQVVSREQLYADVWGGTLRPEDRSVDVYVRRLRMKLAAALPDRAFIHTHFGLGYRLASERSRAFHKSATSS